MIAAWMVAATLFALLIGLAALAAERALRLLRRESRAPWILALAAAVAWPVLAPVASRVLTRPAPVAITVANRPAASAARFIASELPKLPYAWADRADALLLALWACASLVLLTRLALAFRALRRIEGGATSEVLDGVPVLLTPTLGPAVFGVRRPRTIVPRWLLDLDAPLRAIVLRHEQEHCRARDPQLTIGAAIAVALVPWNAGAWWIARRLRLALELDCDVRVMRTLGDRSRYGKLLLFIAQRQSQTRLAPMIAESNSHLSRRITAMSAPRPTHPIPRIASHALVASVAVVFACSPRVSNDLTAPTPGAMPSLSTGTPYKEFKVLREANYASGSGIPRYPSDLRAARVEGAVVAQVVVDTNGRAVPGSLRIERASHELFAQAVRDAAPTLKFIPAEIDGGRKVRQLLRLPIEFSMARMGEARKDVPKAPPADNRVHTLEPMLIWANPDYDPPASKSP